MKKTLILSIIAIITITVSFGFVTNKTNNKTQNIKSKPAITNQIEPTGGFVIDEKF